MEWSTRFWRKSVGNTDSNLDFHCTNLNILLVYWRERAVNNCKTWFFLLANKQCTCIYVYVYTHTHIPPHSHSSLPPLRRWDYSVLRQANSQHTFLKYEMSIYPTLVISGDLPERNCYTIKEKKKKHQTSKLEARKWSNRPDQVQTQNSSTAYAYVLIPGAPFSSCAGDAEIRRSQPRDASLGMPV